ncbi:hypothetical protein [Thiothrix subterranea]|uniref:Uncharacterized protein n=1 Tax=Thiothrix subterranea TaxID=2735563 RepID=A0AA51R2R6_9GAMM|nr:hypothetical protein [Thiothrix subterranea]MDQ5768647.1 hypothetical protein [Thiothrix subterranea]WML84800.1 hypothetical protein RCG00_00520 [Thiothrix subterranea]
MNGQPQWQPISMLPVFTDMIDGMLESSLEQLQNMQAVKDKPHVLDDSILGRVIALYSEQLQNHGAFQEQFNRWKKTGLCATDLAEVERLIQQLAKLKTANETILGIAKSISHATIDKIMAMDDAELAVAFLSGKLKRPI